DLDARALRRRLRRLAASRRRRAKFREAKRWQPRRLTSAPASIDTVAAFRPWRGFRPSVARGRRGHHGNNQDWRRGRDSNPRSGYKPLTHFPGVLLQPLGHLSVLARPAARRTGPAILRPGRERNKEPDEPAGR